MKKLTAFFLTVALCVTALTGCGSKTQETKTEPANAETTNAETTTVEKSEEETKEEAATVENVHLDTLNVYFVPSRDPEEIVTATEPLSNLMKEELAGLGYDVDEVVISVGTTYEAVGEALVAGTADVGFIPGGTYVLYDDGCDVILTATRDGLSKDSDNAADWNDGQPTEASESQAVSYRALFIAGPSEKGQELAEKVNNGTELTWEDIDSANWSVMSSSSPAGYIYPSLWLQDRYQKGITDLANAVQSDSYASAFARLASGQVDVLVTYADARRDYEEKWTSEFGREASIWEETNVIGVTSPIYNDTVCVSKSAEKMDENLKTAIQTALINIGNTDAGKEVIAIYSHKGYEPAESANYDKEREAQKLIQQLSAAN